MELFIASVEDDQIKNIKVIAAKLKAMGCKIDNILSTVGVITGSTDLPLEKLKIDGISAVETDREISL